MKHTLRFLVVILAALAVTACDTLHDLIAVPPSDYSGRYADDEVLLTNVCGAARDAEFHLNVNTIVTDDKSSLHQFTADVVIHGAGQDGSTVTAQASWTVNGGTKNFSSGFVPNFGTVTLAPADKGFAGIATIYEVECINPGADGGQDTRNYERVNFQFNATRL